MSLKLRLAVIKWRKIPRFRTKINYLSGGVHDLRELSICNLCSLSPRLNPWGFMATLAGRRKSNRQLFSFPCYQKTRRG